MISTLLLPRVITNVEFLNSTYLSDEDYALSVFELKDYQ